MDVEVNFIAVLAATAVAMVIGSVWYSSAIFGKQWRKLENVDEKKIKESQSTASAMIIAMGGMALLSLVMAYVLAHVAYLSDSFYTDYDFQTAAITTGFWMWLGFVVPVVASNSLFGMKPWKLTAINIGNWLVTLLAMGLVIGLIGV